MLVVRWFAGFRFVSDIRESVKYEFRDAGIERCAEFVYPGKEVFWYNREDPARLWMAAINAAKKEGTFLDMGIDGNSVWVAVVRPSEFHIRSRVGFLYQPSATIRCFDRDVWSYLDKKTGRLVATEFNSNSDHTECWVKGAPVGLVIREDIAQNDKFWREVEKTARGLAKIRHLPVYVLTKAPHGHKLRRIN